MRRVPTEDQQHVQWLGCWACNMRYQNSIILLLIRPLESAHVCSVRRAVLSLSLRLRPQSLFRLVLGTAGSAFGRRRSTAAQVVNTELFRLTASLSSPWLLGHDRQRSLTRLAQLTEPLARKEITRIRTGDTGTRSTRERSFCDRRGAVEDKSECGVSTRHDASCFTLSLSTRALHVNRI